MKLPCTLAACCAALLLLLPSAVLAKEKTTPSPEASSSPMAKVKAVAFHGKVAAVDASAKTFTVGKRTFTVTDATKITKEGATATMSDLVVGEKASGSYWKKEGGLLEAKAVKIGAKVEATDSPAAQKKEGKASSEASPSS